MKLKVKDGTHRGANDRVLGVYYYGEVTTEEGREVSCGHYHKTIPAAKTCVIKLSKSPARIAELIELADKREAFRQAAMKRPTERMA
jgi:hypothetical protein